MSRHFTADWFTQYSDNWMKHVGYLKDEKIDILEIGCYEGRSTCWFLDNLMKNKRSIITCVDTWNGADKCLGEQTKEAYNIFRSNTKNRQENVVVHQSKSFDYLVYCHMVPRAYDIIFIDGDHEGYTALGDLILAWPLVKLNGWLVFDDYLWESDKLRTNPEQAWDAFASVKPLGLKWEVDGRLVFAQKVEE